MLPKLNSKNGRFKAKLTGFLKVFEARRGERYLFHTFGKNTPHLNGSMTGLLYSLLVYYTV